ncbi:MAG: hypothetical protein QOE48_742 [Mycobacterium sp.]|nr:hypothetical protein [Mycobacterium sp.]MDT5322013.1 hypothetical protein [Mycobacterium sp.]
MDEAPRILVPPSPEVQRMMHKAVAQLGGVEQLSSSEDSAAPITPKPADIAEQVHSLSPAEVIAAVSLLVAILTLILNMVVDVHDWAKPKTTAPVINQTTSNVTNNETTVNMTNLPPAQPFGGQPGH